MVRPPGQRHPGEIDGKGDSEYICQGISIADEAVYRYRRSCSGSIDAVILRIREKFFQEEIVEVVAGLIGIHLAENAIAAGI